MRIGAALVLFAVACGSPARRQPEVSHPEKTPAPLRFPEARLADEREQAMAALARTCEGRGQHDPARCNELADALDQGSYIPRNPSRATAIRKKLCDEGDARSCSWLTVLGERTAAEKQQLLGRACDLGDLRACERAAEEGPYAERDARRLEIFELYQRRCGDGDTQACLDSDDLAHQIRRTLPTELWEAARAREEQRCAAGSIAACNLAARIHGERIRDRAAEQRFRMRACDLGDASSCFFAAAALEQQGDTTGSELVYRRACDLRNSNACWHVAAYGTEPVEQRAMYLRACVLGDPSSCSSAEIMLEQGTGGGKDVDRARVLHDLMCRAGEERECFTLAELATAAGEPAAALRLYGRSCDLGGLTTGCTSKAGVLHVTCIKGNADACGELDALLGRLSPASRDIVGFECCAERPGVGTSPVASFVRLSRAINAKDLAAVRAFVEPKSGMHVRIGSHGTDFADEDDFVVRADKIDLSRIEGVAQVMLSHLECPDTFDGDDKAQCTAFEGGFAGSYVFKRDGANIYAVDINEESH